MCYVTLNYGRHPSSFEHLASCRSIVDLVVGMVGRVGKMVGNGVGTAAAFVGHDMKVSGAVATRPAVARSGLPMWAALDIA